MASSLRIAHISDIHFGKVSFNPLQFFSKQCIGNLNFLFRRKKTFSGEAVEMLYPLLKELKATHLLITGDLTTTSRRAEYQRAKEFCEKFESSGIKIFTIPGNHDHYTLSAYKERRFYNFFASSYAYDFPYTLKEDRLTLSPLKESVWLVLLDTTLATLPFSARGIFTKELEENLKVLLQKLPRHHTILLATHYPLFNNEGIARGLGRAQALQEILLKNPQIKLYLHGHNHRHCIADLRASGYPIILDSGSVTYKKHPTFNFLQLETDSCTVTPYRFHGKWNQTNQVRFSL